MYFIIVKATNYKKNFFYIDLNKTMKNIYQFVGNLEFEQYLLGGLGCIASATGNTITAYILVMHRQQNCEHPLKIEIQSKRLASNLELKQYLVEDLDWITSVIGNSFC